MLKRKGADILHALPFISSRSLCQKVINSHQTPCKLQSGWIESCLDLMLTCVIQKPGINYAYELALFYRALERDENILNIKKGSTP